MVARDLAAKWRAVARLAGELEQLGRVEDRLAHLYESLKSLLGMEQARFFQIDRPMADLEAPGRNQLPFFEYLALQRQPVLVSNAESEGLGLPEEIRTWTFPTLLFIPVISREQALGILTLGSSKLQDLGGAEGELIAAILPIAAHSLRIDTLVRETERQALYNRVVEEFDSTIAAKPVPEILAAAVSLLQRALSAECTVLFVRKGIGSHASMAGTAELAVAAAAGCPYAAAGGLQDAPCGALAQRAAGYRRTEVQNLAGLRQLGARRPLCQERQAVAVPIVSGVTVYGVLEVFDRQDGCDFESKEIELAERIATRMALAIANGELISQVTKAGVDAIKGLATALDAKDSYTASHSQNVGEYSYRIAAAMGLAPDRCERFRLAGILHDLGKIGIPDEVLNKPTRLTQEEFSRIRSHPAVTARILEHFSDLADVRQAAACHHERWDGLGYPDGLSGAAIPLGARVICLADAFDTLTSDRKYRRRLPLEDVLLEMRRGAGCQFDPDCVDALFRALAELGPTDLNGNTLPPPKDLERFQTAFRLTID